jgi:hypothetical protein
MRTTYGPEAATLANACLHYVFDLWAPAMAKAAGSR